MCFLFEYNLTCNWLLWSKLNFQHHYTVFSVTWSFSNNYNILICCSRNISYYYHQCWKQMCCLICFCWNSTAFIWNKKYLKYKFNSSLVNKSIFLSEYSEYLIQYWKVLLTNWFKRISDLTSLFTWHFFRFTVFLDHHIQFKRQDHNATKIWNGFAVGHRLSSGAGNSHIHETLSDCVALVPTVWKLNEEHDWCSFTAGHYHPDNRIPE